MRNEKATYDRRTFIGIASSVLAVGLPTSAVSGSASRPEPSGRPGLRFLTSDPAFVDSRPCFSPDGEHVLFMRAPAGADPVRTANSNASPWSLWTVPRSGGSPSVFFEHPEVGLTRPAWSRTSGRIALSGIRAGAGELWILEEDGSDLSRVPVGDPPMEALFYPSWFPDGVTVAVTDYRERRLLAVDTRDGTFRPLTDPSVIAAGMCGVSPDDGAEYPVAFAGQRPGATYDVAHNSIWLRDGRGRVVELDGLHGRTPSWSPTGEWLAYSSTRPRPAPFATLHHRSLPGGSSSVFIVKSPGDHSWSSSASVTPLDHVALHARWSPDGLALVCMASDSRTGRSGIALVEVADIVTDAARP